MLQRDSEAEEGLREVFLRLYRNGPGVAASGLVGGWLYRTATRASIDALRANWLRQGVEEQLEDNGSVETEGPTESPLTLLLRRDAASSRSARGAGKAEGQRSFAIAPQRSELSRDCPKPCKSR